MERSQCFFAGVSILIVLLVAPRIAYTSEGFFVKAPRAVCRSVLEVLGLLVVLLMAIISGTSWFTLATCAASAYAWLPA